MNGLAVDFVQQGIQTVAVSIAHPIELETIGHPDGQALSIGREFSHQGPDPGVELLFGNFLGQPFDALLPEAGFAAAHVDILPLNGA